MVVLKMKYARRVKAKGREYWYYRRDGVNIAPLPHPDDKTFLSKYSRIHADYESAAPASRTITEPESVKELVEQYLASPFYLKNKPNTLKSYRRYADLLCRLLGDQNRHEVKQSTILGLRDDLAETPGKANEFVKVARVIFGWGMPRDLVKFNPADFRGTDIKPLELGEYQPWPEPLIEKALNEDDMEVVWVLIGLLYTGQRIGDTLGMGRLDIVGGKIRVTQQKTGKPLMIPIHSRLQAVLDVIPKRSTRIFTSLTGKVWSYDNFRHQWDKKRKRLNAGGYVLHGLRKNAVIRLRQAGCTIEQTGAVTGQSEEMVKYYSRQMEQEHLAEVAMRKLEVWGRDKK